MTRWRYDSINHMLEIYQDDELVLEIPRELLVEIVDDLHHTRDFEEIYCPYMEIAGG